MAIGTNQATSICLLNQKGGCGRGGIGWEESGTREESGEESGGGIGDTELFLGGR